MADADAFGPHVPVVGGLASAPGGSAWLAALPDLVAELEREWAIATDAPYLDGIAAWTAPAVTSAGQEAVLKVSWPHREARGEAVALRFWDGDGAIRVLRSDPERSAMLLERCVPGAALRATDLPVGEQQAVAAGLLRRLWARPPTAALPLERLGDVAADWATTAAERWARLGGPTVLDGSALGGGSAAHDGADTDRLVALGIALLRELPASASEEVVIHGDCNPGNLLSAQREPWLAIDPKPMIGDPAYDLWPLLTQLGAPLATATPAAVRARAGQLGSLVDQPTERLLAWSVARGVESALWHADRGEADMARQQLAEAALLARAGGL